MAKRRSRPRGNPRDRGSSSGSRGSRKPGSGSRPPQSRGNKRSGDNGGGRRPDRKKTAPPSGPERIGVNKDKSALDEGDTLASCKIVSVKRGKHDVLVGQTPEGYEITIPRDGIDLSAVDHDGVVIEIVSAGERTVTIGKGNNRREAVVVQYIGVPTSQKAAWEAAVAAKAAGSDAGSGSVDKGAGSQSPDNSANPDSSSSSPALTNENLNHTLDLLDPGAEVECTVAEEQPATADQQARYYARSTDPDKPYRIALPVGVDYSDVDLTQPVKIAIESRKDPDAGARKPRVHYLGWPEGIEEDARQEWRDEEEERQRVDRFKRIPLALTEGEVVAAAELTDIGSTPEDPGNKRRYHMQAPDGRDVYVTTSLGWLPDEERDGSLRADIAIFEARERGTHYEAMLQVERDFALAYERFSRFVHRWLQVIQAVNERIPTGEPGEGDFVHAMDENMRGRLLDNLREAFTTLDSVGLVITGLANGSDSTTQISYATPDRLNALLQELEADVSEISRELPMMRASGARRSVDRRHQLIMDLERHLSQDATIIQGPPPDLAAVQARVDQLSQDLDRERAPRIRARSADKSAEEVRLEQELEEAERVCVKAEEVARHWWPQCAWLDYLQEAIEELEMRNPDIEAEAFSGDGFDNLRRVINGLEVPGRGVLFIKNDPVFRASADFSDFTPIHDIDSSGSMSAGVARDGSFVLRSAYQVDNAGRTEMRHRQLTLQPGDSVENLRVNADGIVLFDTGDDSSGTTQLRNKRRAELVAQGGLSADEIEAQLDELSNKCTIQEFVQLITNGIINLELPSRSDAEAVSTFVRAMLPAAALVRFLRREPIALGSSYSYEAFENRGSEVLQVIEDHIFGTRLRTHLGLDNEDFERISIGRAPGIPAGRDELLIEITIDESDYSKTIAIKGDEAAADFNALRAELRDALIDVQVQEDLEEASGEVEGENERLAARNYTEMRPGARGEIVDAQVLASALLRSEPFDPVPTTFEVRYAGDDSGQLVLVIGAERVRLDESVWRELFAGEQEALRFTQNMPEPELGDFESTLLFCEELGIDPPVRPGDVFEYRAVADQRERGRIQAQDGSDTPALIAGTRIVVQRFVPAIGRDAQSQVRFLYFSAVNEKGEVGDSARVGDKDVDVMWDLPVDEFMELLRARQPLARFARVEFEGAVEQVQDQPLPTAEELLQEREDGRPINGEQLIQSLGLPTESFKKGIEDDSGEGYVVRFVWNGDNVPTQGDERSLRNGDVCRVVGFDDDHQEVIIALEDEMGRLVVRDFRVTYSEMILASHLMEPAPHNRLYLEIQRLYGIHDPITALMWDHSFVDENGKMIFLHGIDDEKIHFYPQGSPLDVRHLTHQEFIDKLGTADGTIHYTSVRAWAVRRHQSDEDAISGYYVPEDQRRTPRDRMFDIMRQSFNGDEDSPLYLGVSNPETALLRRDFAFRFQHPESGQTIHAALIVNAAGLRDNSITFMVEGDAEERTLTYNGLMDAMRQGHIVYRPLAVAGDQVRTVRLNRPQVAPEAPAREPRPTVVPVVEVHDEAPVPSAPSQPAPHEAPIFHPPPTAEQLRAASSGVPSVTPERRVERGVGIPPIELPKDLMFIEDILEGVPGDNINEQAGHLASDIEQKIKRASGRAGAWWYKKEIAAVGATIRRLFTTDRDDIIRHRNHFLRLRQDRRARDLDEQFSRLIADEQSLLREIQTELGHIDEHTADQFSARQFLKSVNDTLDVTDHSQAGHWHERMSDIKARYSLLIDRMYVMRAGENLDLAPHPSFASEDDEQESSSDLDELGGPLNIEWDSLPSIDEIGASHSTSRVDDPNFWEPGWGMDDDAGRTTRVSPEPAIDPERLRASAAREGIVEPLIGDHGEFNAAWAASLTGPAAASMRQIELLRIRPDQLAHGLAEYGTNIEADLLPGNVVQITRENEFPDAPIPLERFLRLVATRQFRPRE